MVLDKMKYVDNAENVIKELKEESKREVRGKVRYNWITTSKIRNLLAMTADIYNQVLESDETLNDDIISRIDYLRVRVVYECGRDNEGTVKNFVNKARILEAIKEIGSSREKYIIFSHYMESLVAYHKFYGGKD